MRIFDIHTTQNNQYTIFICVTLTYNYVNLNFIQNSISFEEYPLGMNTPYFSLEILSK